MHSHQWFLYPCLYDNEGTMGSIHCEVLAESLIVEVNLAQVWFSGLQFSFDIVY